MLANVIQTPFAEQTPFVSKAHQSLDCGAAVAQNILPVKIMMGRLLIL